MSLTEERCRAVISSNIFVDPAVAERLYILMVSLRTRNERSDNKLVASRRRMVSYFTVHGMDRSVLSFVKARRPDFFRLAMTVLPDGGHLG